MHPQCLNGLASQMESVRFLLLWEKKREAKRRCTMDKEERIGTHACKVWLHGLLDEDPSPTCLNCDMPIEVDRLEPPASTGDLLLCPQCGAELAFGSIEATYTVVQFMSR